MKGQKSNCRYCKTAFLRKKGSRRVYCSPKCSIEWRNYVHRNFTPDGKAYCKVCTKEFIRPKGHPNKYCTQECYLQYRRDQSRKTKVFGKCGWCNTEILISGTRRKWCSEPCRGKNYYKNSVGAERLKRYSENPDNKEAILASRKKYNRSEKRLKRDRRYQNNNPQKVYERRFVAQHRQFFESVWSTECLKCGKTPIEFDHLKYDNLPHNNLKEYAKWIRPLCRQCHSKRTWVERRKKTNKKSVKKE